MTISTLALVVGLLSPASIATQPSEPLALENSPSASTVVLSAPLFHGKPGWGRQEKPAPKEIERLPLEERRDSRTKRFGKPGWGR